MKACNDDIIVYMKFPIRYWIYPAFVASVIFFFSSLPGPVVDASVLGSKILQINGHFWLYVVLAISIYKPTKKLGYCLLFALMYAVVDELHQLYTPFRSVSLVDVITDTLGASLGSLMLWKLLPTLPKKLSNWLKS